MYIVHEANTTYVFYETLKTSGLKSTVRHVSIGRSYLDYLFLSISQIFSVFGLDSSIQSDNVKL